MPFSIVRDLFQHVHKKHISTPPHSANYSNNNSPELGDNQATKQSINPSILEDEVNSDSDSDG
jgi:hypothetical protein